MPRGRPRKNPLPDSQLLPDNLTDNLADNLTDNLISDSVDKSSKSKSLESRLIDSLPENEIDCRIGCYLYNDYQLSQHPELEQKKYIITKKFNFNSEGEDIFTAWLCYEKISNNKPEKKYKKFIEGNDPFEIYEKIYKEAEKKIGIQFGSDFTVEAPDEDELKTVVEEASNEKDTD